MPTVEPHDWTPLRIKELRVRLGKTQAEFATILNQLSGRRIARTRVAHWEGGYHRPMLFWLPFFRDLERAAPKLQRPIVDFRRVLND